MNVLDENIPSDQREQLERRRLPLRQIGIELGNSGMGDDDIIPLLHRLPHPPRSGPANSVAPQPPPGEHPRPPR